MNEESPGNKQSHGMGKAKMSRRRRKEKKKMDVGRRRTQVGKLSTPKQDCVGPEKNRGAEIG
jgi:hypothetical protein